MSRHDEGSDAEARPCRTHSQRRHERPLAHRASGNSSSVSTTSLVLSHILEPKAPVTRPDRPGDRPDARHRLRPVESLVRGHMVTEFRPTRRGRRRAAGVPLAPASGTIVGIGAEVAVDRLGVTAIDLNRTGGQPARRGARPARQRPAAHPRPALRHGA